MRSLTMYIIRAPKYHDYKAAITKFLIIIYISVIPMLPSIHDKEAGVYVGHIKFSSNYNETDAFFHTLFSNLQFNLDKLSIKSQIKIQTDIQQINSCVEETYRSYSMLSKGVTFISFALSKAKR